MPWGICVDRVGDVYVADWKNGRVQKFSPDGQFLSKFEGSEGGVGALERPSGVGGGLGWRRLCDRLERKIYSRYMPRTGPSSPPWVGDAQQLSPWAQTYVDANPDIIKARQESQPGSGMAVREAVGG